MLSWDLPGLWAGVDEAGRGPLAGPVVAEVEAEWTAHLGAGRMADLRSALVALREVTDPFR